MSSIRDIPEVAALDGGGDLVRLPPECDVPTTHRVRQIIDSADFRRLARVSQLGLVSLVYPAALHTRMEHSLGVYRLALLYLQRLSRDERFTALVTREAAERFIAAALLHDLGHWPFCHPIEDLHLPSVPHHELFANSFLLEGEIADTLREDWGIQPRDVVALLSEQPREKAQKLLASMLSGPIDIDKMDYLERDSLHAGVPYGRHFDQARLISSLCLNRHGDALAITQKGRTAAELMVFARYVMFSEVYWHHAVRAATAMLQRAFYLLHRDLDLDALFRMTESDMISQMMSRARRGPAYDLLDSLFGPSRRLYKRVAQYTFLEHGEIYLRLARRPYPWLVECASEFATLASTALGRVIAPHEVLFDAPPVEREVEFDIDVFYPKEDVYRRLADVSPVSRTLAEKQFDDYVKRVRIFAHRRVASDLADRSDLSDMLTEAIDRTD